MTSLPWWTVFKKLGNSFQSVGIFLSDGTQLLGKSEFSPDLASFSDALKVVRATLNIKFPQIGMLNDPQFGGSLLSTCTFVFPLGKEPSSPWVVCRSESVHLPLLKKLWSEESLKLPPLPLPTDSNEQLTLLNSISSHPMAPPFWKNQLPLTLSAIKRTQSSWSQTYSKFWTKSVGEKLNQDAARCIHSHLDVASNLEIKHQVNFGNGVNINIKAHLENSILLVDFSGSSVSDFGIPSVWVQGIVMAVANQFLDLKESDYVFGAWSSKLHLVTSPRSVVSQNLVSGSQAQWLLLSSALTKSLLLTFNKIFTQKKAEHSNSQILFQLQSEAGTAETFFTNQFETQDNLSQLGELVECIQLETGKSKRSIKTLADCTLRIWSFCQLQSEFEFMINLKKINLNDAAYVLKANDIISFE